jgi:hypothetical protein
MAGRFRTGSPPDGCWWAGSCPTRPALARLGRFPAFHRCAAARVRHGRHRSARAVPGLRAPFRSAEPLHHRPMTLLAAATGTCCSTTARTPVSKGAKVPGGANAWVGSLQRSDDRVVGELASRLAQVEVEAGDAPGPTHQVQQLLPVRQMRAEQQMVPASLPELEHPRVASDRDGPTVDPVRDLLDPWRRVRPEVGQDRGPVERALEWQAQQQATVGHQPVGLAASGAQHLGRGPEHLLARPVELAQAPEPGREGDLGDGEVGVVQQPASEMGPCRAGQPIGRHPEMGGEQATEMPARHAQPGTTPWSAVDPGRHDRRDSSHRPWDTSRQPRRLAASGHGRERAA